MPKATKLYSKGKASSMQKPCKIETDVSTGTDPEESVRQFQLELCWCIQQLERSLSEKKSNEKQMQEIWKVLTVLKNNNQPIIRKRQLMRTHFGDYRAKMAAEEKKLVKMASKIKITESPAQPKATFLRKSVFLSTGDNSFRFNFDLNSEQIDSDNTTQAKEETIITNTKSNLKEKIDDEVIENEDTNKDLSSTDSDINDANKTVINNSNNFKFKFSKSEFKFNFCVDS